MKQVCLSSSVVFVLNRANIYEDFNTSEVEDIIKNSYSEPQSIAVNSFPDEVKVLAAVNINLQVVAQRNKAFVSSHIINETNEAESDFLRVAFKLKEYFKRQQLKIEGVGFNFEFALQDEEFSSIEDKIRTKYFKDESIVPQGAKVQFALPVLSFVDERGIVRFFAYKADRDLDNNPVRITVDANAHYDNAESVMPSVEDFIENFKDTYRYTYKQIDLGEG